MILPTKHISETQALVGVGAALLHCLKTPETVTSLWEKARALSNVATYERYILALDMLYLVGAIDLQNGLIVRMQS